MNDEREIYLVSEVERLQKENEQLKANSLIQEHIVENGGNPLDKDKIVRLIMEKSAFQAELERVTAERDAAVKDLEFVCRYSHRCEMCFHGAEDITMPSEKCAHDLFNNSECERFGCWKWRGLEDTKK